MVGLPLFHKLFDRLAIVHALLEDLPRQRRQLAVAREAQRHELRRRELRNPRNEIGGQQRRQSERTARTLHLAIVTIY